MKQEPIDLSASAQELSALISTQPGSVVSRALINKPAGTVTLFSFDMGQGLSEHTAPYDALVYILDGEADIRIATQEHVVKSGSIILLPGNIPHALFARESFKMLLVMIRA